MLFKRKKNNYVGKAVDRLLYAFLFYVDLICILKLLTLGSLRHFFEQVIVVIESQKKKQKVVRSLLNKQLNQKIPLLFAQQKILVKIKKDLPSQTSNFSQ